MRSLCIALSAGLAWSTPALVAAAGSGPGKIAIVPVDLGKDGDPALAGALLQALEAGTSGGGTKVVRVAEPCADADCFADAARQSGATHIISAKVDVDVNDYRVELVAHDQSGTPRHSLEFDCEICTRADLEQRLEREAAALKSKLEAPVDAPDAQVATISVTTDPAGARVFVDGKQVGTSPYRGPVDPGRHVLKVEADGYAPESSRFEASGGGQSSFTLSLDSAQGRDETTKKKRLTIAGYSSLGVGLGTVVAGAVLLGIDSRPVQSRCSGDSIDINGECEFLHDTVIPGAVLTSVGAAAVVTGVVLVIVGRPGRKGESKRRAAVTIGGVKF